MFHFFYLDPEHENSLKNQEFFEFYVKENTEGLLTTEQWDMQEEKQNDRMFWRGRYARACRSEIKLV